jgi:hypothetical protein
MEAAHFEVFGESMASRQGRKATLQEALEQGNDNYLNIPAYERVK